MHMKHSMSPWKQVALDAYYHGTRPYRAWLRWRLACEERLPWIVLFYHRVAERSDDCWTCSRETFEREMRWLKRNVRLVSLDEGQWRIRSGRSSELCVSVTFDDGYAENCDFAIPLLLEMQIPCTYFVASRFVLDAQPFPHDVALGRPRMPNTPDQLREMARSGIEIGAHTRTHADLGSLHGTALRDEIVGSRQDLEDLLGNTIDKFAFPYGMPANMNHEAFQVARQAGFTAVCSAYGAMNFPESDPFHVERVHGDAEFARMRNWVSLDPRKLRPSHGPKFEYVPEPAPLAATCSITT
jgi:peptidoglycan/xylan/chitin deacetylase (PgdA/CDA1 family)